MSWYGNNSYSAKRGEKICYEKNLHHFVTNYDKSFFFISIIVSSSCWFFFYFIFKNFSILTSFYMQICLLFIECRRIGSSMSTNKTRYLQKKGYNINKVLKKNVKDVFFYSASSRYRYHRFLDIVVEIFCYNVFI